MMLPSRIRFLRRRPRGRATKDRSGLSLLEVILSLAILAGAVATIGELVRQGSQHAQSARDLTRAQLLCESLLGELQAGLREPEPAADVRIDDDWSYSIEAESLDNDGVRIVRLTVSQNRSASTRPVEFSVVHWMPDPDAVAAAEEAAAAAAEAAAEASSSESESGSGGSSGATSTGGGASG